MTYCLFHKSDLDGHACGALFRYFNGDSDLTMFGVDYDDKVPEEILSTHKLIYILDFSYPKNIMEKIQNKTIWIDHHKTAIEELKDIRLINKYTGEVAACELTWKFFTNQKELPRGLRYISKYDTHTIDEEWDDVNYFQLGMKARKTDPRVLEAYKFWILIFEKANDKIIDEIIDEGKIISKYIKNQEEYLSKKVFFTEFHGINTVAYNGPNGNNIIKKFLSQDAPLGLFYQVVDNTGKTNVSLRGNGIVDVSKIAKMWGGGGHKNAAGFNCHYDVLMKILIK